MSHVSNNLRARSLRRAASILAIATLAVVSALPIHAFRVNATEAAAAPVPGAFCAPGVQLLGYSDALNKTSFGGFAVGELSGLAYDRSSDSYYAVADRAGAVPTHMFGLSVPVFESAVGTPAITSVTTLTGPSGSVLNGLNFDAEAVVLTRPGDIIVASESGSAAGQQPEAVRFASDGTYIADLAVPAKFLIGPNNGSFESLALSPNGHSLFTAMELPLAVDGRTTDLRSRLRILRWENRGPEGYAPMQEFFYLTEPGRSVSDVGVAELVALSETDLLVLERGFVAGMGNTIRIFHFSLREAPEVSGVPALATAEAGLFDAALAAKTLLVDVASCPASGAVNPPDDPANPLLENFEGMTLGPQVQGGWQSLILISDDNLAPNQTTRVVALAVIQPLLVGQDGLPEPSN